VRIQDEASRSLKTRELARLQLRRAMELGMAASLAGAIAAAIGAYPIAARAHSEWLVLLPFGVAAPIEALFYLRWRSPPAAAVDRFARRIKSERKAGARPAAFSRDFVAIAFVLALGAALALVRFLARS
jgi:hypothetical protein